MLEFKNIVNMSFISERKEDCKLPKDDTRFTAFQCDPVTVFPSYQRDIGPKMGRAFYQFLMARDITKYTPGVFGLLDNRPITSLYDELRGLA